MLKSISSRMSIYDLLLYAYFSCVCFSSDIFSCYFIHVSFIFSLCCKAELPQVIFTDSLYYSILAQALRTSTKTHLSKSLWLDVYSSFCKPIWSMYIIDTFTYLYKRRVLFPFNRWLMTIISPFCLFKAVDFTSTLNCCHFTSETVTRRSCSRLCAKLFPLEEI